MELAPDAKTDGQVLVITDVLGFTPRNFQHNRRYQDVGRLMLDAAKAYVAGCPL